MTAAARAVNPEALEQLLGQVISDAGGAVILPLALLGDRLGLFVELGSGGPATAAELAGRTGLAERYLREWLLAMAAAGYVTYQGDAPGAEDPGSKRAARYGLSAEQAEAFTNPDSPGYVAGIMAQTYPASSFVGVDFHRDSIELAKSRAEAAGMSDRVEFRMAGATDLEGTYDFITFFDCLHDMPDPLGALRTARAAIADSGAVMLVEPMSWDTVADGLNPLGRLLAGASLLVCLPCGLSGPPAAGLGNQAGPARTMQLAREAGFSDARVATATDFNLVYELRP
jgi:SAM-dependent methyltransferase